MRRDPSLLAAQFGLTCAVALIVGVIFYKLTKDLEVCRLHNGDLPVCVCPETVLFVSCSSSALFFPGHPNTHPLSPSLLFLLTTCCPPGTAQPDGCPVLRGDLLFPAVTVFRGGIVQRKADVQSGAGCW
jgi:hypothetical protein